VHNAILRNRRHAQQTRATDPRNRPPAQQRQVWGGSGAALDDPSAASEDQQRSADRDQRESQDE
jgi:hypothetical protein